MCRLISIVFTFIVRKLFSRTWLYYYLHYLLWPVTFILWGIFVIVVRQYGWFFDGASFPDTDWVLFVGKICIIIGILRIIFRSFTAPLVLISLFLFLVLSFLFFFFFSSVSFFCFLFLFLVSLSFSRFFLSLSHWLMIAITIIGVL